jgi:hypothetical protein
MTVANSRVAVVANGATPTPTTVNRSSIGLAYRLGASAYTGPPIIHSSGDSKGTDEALECLASK